MHKNIISITHLLIPKKDIFAFDMSGTPVTQKHIDKMAKITFSSVYPYYVKKIESKGRTKGELHQIISWLTGFTESQIDQCIKDNLTFAQLFSKATIHPNAALIKGMICGYRIEEIEDTLTRQVRYLDKLIDELAKGKSMDKILRK